MVFKLTVKSTTGDKVELDVESLDMKVSELKAMLEQKTSIPASEQRLIFAGHVLKDDNTLVSHNIKESGVTLNMVRSAPRRPDPAPEAQPQPSRGAPGGGAMAGMRGLLSDPQAAQMLLQLLQNPEILQEAMRSNPELASPEFQAALQQLRSNPAALRQLIEAMSEEGGGGMDAHTFTADELRTALSGVMSSLNISAGPPSKPVTPEDFKAAFAAAVGNLRRGGARGQGPAAAGPAAGSAPRQRPEHRFITKDFLQQCLTNVMSRL